MGAKIFSLIFSRMAFNFVSIPGLNNFAHTSILSVNFATFAEIGIHRFVDSGNGISILKVQMEPSAVDRKSILLYR